MTRRYVLFAGLMALWLLALGIVAKTAIDKITVPPWGNPIGDRLSVEIAGGTQVGQQFTAPWPGLYGIQVMLDQATATEAREITFHLKTSPSAATDLWVSSFSSGDVQASTPFYIEFAPLRNSQGQTYYVYLESATSTSGNAIAARYSPDAVLDGASAYLNAQPSPGNLQFHTFYSLTTREKVDLLLTRMAQGRPYFLGTKGFYVGLALVYALVLSAFVLYVGKIILEEQERQA